MSHLSPEFVRVLTEERLAAAEQRRRGRAVPPRRRRTRPDVTGTPLRRQASWEAVLAWWRAVQEKDLTTLAAVLDPTHVSVGGPGGRSVGRANVLAEVEQFFVRRTVDAWRVWDRQHRELGESIVYSYRWDESGHDAGTPFRLSGVATDVLVPAGGTWLVAVHHTSTEPDGSA